MRFIGNINFGNWIKKSPLWDMFGFRQVITCQKDVKLTYWTYFMTDTHAFSGPILFTSIDWGNVLFNNIDQLMKIDYNVNLLCRQQVLSSSSISKLDIYKFVLVIKYTKFSDMYFIVWTILPTVWKQFRYKIIYDAVRKLRFYCWITLRMGAWLHQRIYHFSVKG